MCEHTHLFERLHLFILLSFLFFLRQFSTLYIQHDGTGTFPFPPIIITPLPLPPSIYLLDHCFIPSLHSHLSSWLQIKERVRVREQRLNIELIIPLCMSQWGTHGYVLYLRPWHHPSSPPTTLFPLVSTHPYSAFISSHSLLGPTWCLCGYAVPLFHHSCASHMSQAFKHIYTNLIVQTFFSYQIWMLSTNYNYNCKTCTDGAHLTYT